MRKPAANTCANRPRRFAASPRSSITRPTTRTPLGGKRSSAIARAPMRQSQYVKASSGRTMSATSASSIAVASRSVIASFGGRATSNHPDGDTRREQARQQKERKDDQSEWKQRAEPQRRESVERLSQPQTQCE